MQADEWSFVVMLDDLVGEESVENSSQYDKDYGNYDDDDDCVS